MIDIQKKIIKKKESHFEWKPLIVDPNEAPFSTPKI